MNRATTLKGPDEPSRAEKSFLAVPVVTDRSGRSDLGERLANSALWPTRYGLATMLGHTLDAPETWWSELADASLHDVQGHVCAGGHTIKIGR